MTLATRYLGLTLPSPVVASASPLTGNVRHLRALEAAGAGAVVLPSLFASELAAADKREETLRAAGACNSPEVSSYFPVLPPDSQGEDRYLDLIRRARAALAIPVIASLHASDLEHWTQHARQCEEAGASALELNIHFVATNLTLSGAEIEQRHVDTVRAVRARTTLPLAVKVSPYFTAPGHFLLRLVDAGADGLVLFNRYQQPDIDVVRLQMTNAFELSHARELRVPLQWIALLHGRVSASLAASTGVHSVNDVIKFLLAGADVVMTAAVLLQHGSAGMHPLVSGLKDWLRHRGMDSLLPLRGLLSRDRAHTSADFIRANNLQTLQGYQPGAHALHNPIDAS